ncbi:MAG: hypothetical protein IPI46_04980 [Bacteroidetes bacterium]|nr:hypothetical protein [Bacteroidota bacterium]
MKNLLFILFMSFTLQSIAQDPAKIVKWKFSSTKGNAEHQYVITAVATIDSGWHVFAPEPGGDGLLIPTDLQFNGKNMPKNVGKFTPRRRPITHEMEGVGMVNYYEGEVDFIIIVEVDKAQTLTGMVSFQCCNDKMCLPPTDVPFTIKL